ncbi:CLUMA_CG015421, isoform A [Clunio marinus]|uniref:CLUMA_CG015421, isoform A n=1 Tax=Clunio marinus TaxID=568069 RepID=A0A1J1IR80_9DIPT|nr:CLUMA_CG015421, isoform A [Clunio marinus]
MLKKSIILMLLLVPLINPNVYILNINEIENNEVNREEPPPYTEYAKMARWLVHNVEWTAMGTISTYPTINGFPMVNVIAIADSEKGAKSTGNIYFYLTMLDFTAQDLSKKNQLTALLTMDQNLYCTKQNVDPMEPTCARSMISGEALRVPKDSKEFEFATNAMISHHPASVNWLNTHNFFLCKLNISSICILDWYGGPHFVTVEDYYKADIDSNKNKFPHFN